MYKFWGQNPYLYKIACFITFMGREKRLRAQAVKLLDLKLGDRVLDLCCGTGLNFAHIEKVIGIEGKLTGVDLSPDMLGSARKLAQHQGWNNTVLINEDATKLNLPTNGFDGVISTLGISTIPEHKKALENAKRLVKTGKRVVVMDAESFSGVWRILNPLIKLIYKKTADWDYKKNLIGTFQEVFPKAIKEEYNQGTIYIIGGEKE